MKYTKLLSSTVALAITVAASTAAAQNFANDTPFRAEWRVERNARAAPVLTGSIHNPRPYAVMRVQLRVDVLDASGNTVANRYGWVSGDIPADGHGYFFLPLRTTGASYRVTVVSFEPLFRGGL